MLFRIACVLIATATLQSPAVAQAEEEVVAAIRARLDANRRHDMAAWATFVADDMMAPLEGPRRSKESRIYRDLGATDRIVRKIK
jgi:hypothetical protein